MPMSNTDSRNGEVAQRVADIVFTAFDVMSGSHGSMNGTHLMYKKWTWAETSEHAIIPRRRVLRDSLRGRFGRPVMAWSICHPHQHDQYAYR